MRAKIKKVTKLYIKKYILFFVYRLPSNFLSTLNQLTTTFRFFVYNL